MFALIRKDLRIFFVSPIAYVTLALFLFLTGYAFSSQLYELSPGQLPEASMRGMMYFMAVVLLFLTPLLTMRSFAEEARLRTLELLKTAPLSDTQLVMAKFLAAWLFYSVLIVSTAVYPLIMWIVAVPDGGPMALAYLGLWLLGAAYLSVGIFASSLVESPLLAALLAFVSLLFLWFIGGGEMQWVEHISIIRHLESFSMGVLDVADVGYYLLFTVAFLFLAIRWHEASRWK